MSHPDGARLPLLTPEETARAVTGEPVVAPFTPRRADLAVYRALAANPEMLNAWLPLCDFFLETPGITPHDTWMGMPSYGWIPDKSQYNNYAPREDTPFSFPYQSYSPFLWGKFLRLSRYYKSCWQSILNSLFQVLLGITPSDQTARHSSTCPMETIGSSCRSSSLAPTMMTIRNGRRI